MSEKVSIPFELLGPGWALIIENVGASGWVAVLRDRNGQSRFLSQADDPKEAVELLQQRLGEAMMEILNNGAQAMVESGAKMATAFDAGIESMRLFLENRGDMARN